MSNLSLPLQIVIGGAGAAVFAADRTLIVSLAHSDEDAIALWARIVTAVNAHDSCADALRQTKAWREGLRGNGPIIEFPEGLIDAALALVGEGASA